MRTEARRRCEQLTRAFEKIQSVTGMSTEDDIVQNFNSRDIILSELDAKMDGEVVEEASQIATVRKINWM